MKDSKIEWCSHTFNPWLGCTKVSPGCDNCYAETWAKRYGTVEWGTGKPRKLTSDANWRQPMKWDKEAAAAGVRPRVFCASLADVFDNEVPAEWRLRLWDLIRATPHLDWLLLTKRVGNVAKMFPADWRDGWPNVWLGVSVVNQKEADRDIGKLLRLPARARFLSMEPLLGNVDLRLNAERWVYCNVPEYGGAGTELIPMHNGLHWIIVGGESGKDARPMHPAWVRSLRDQCVAADIPFFFKQWGEYGTRALIGDKPVFREFPCHQTWVNKAQSWLSAGDACLDAKGRRCRNGTDMRRAEEENAFPMTIMHKIGKKAAGRLLDGHAWDESPEDAWR